MKSPNIFEQILVCEEEFVKTHDRRATREEVDRYLTIACRRSPEVVSAARAALRVAFPLLGKVEERDFFWQAREDELFHARTYPRPLPSHPDSGLEVEEREKGKEIIRILDEVLGDREKEVIKDRFGFGGRTPTTLEEIGKRQGVGRERIRQIEVRALKKLRRSPLAQTLRSFVWDEAPPKLSRKPESIEPTIRAVPEVVSAPVQTKRRERIGKAASLCVATEKFGTVRLEVSSEKETEGLLLRLLTILK